MGGARGRKAGSMMRHDPDVTEETVETSGVYVGLSKTLSRHQLQIPICQQWLIDPERISK